jgi:hypothetical protein
MKIKALFRITTVLGILTLLSGCNTLIVNRTPATLPENPSGLYTFSFQADFGQHEVVPDSVRAEIIINGLTYPMTLNKRLGKWVYEFDYDMPENQNEVKYYYHISYDWVQGNNVVQHAEHYSTEDSPNNRPYITRLINRYVIQMESNRGPVGSEITIVGRGFNQLDKVVINGEEVDTQFKNENALSFTVPSLPSGQSYPVEIRSGDFMIDAGYFRVDVAELSVLPDSLVISQGDSEMMLFRIFFEAPAGGLYIDVTTDKKDFVVMPEVIIPEGAMSVNIPVTGHTPGYGKLYVKAPGFNEKVINVVVEESPVIGEEDTSIDSADADDSLE